jgi:hypothetical protein
MSMRIDFAPTGFSGVGEDFFGPFNVIGRYGPATNAEFFEKHYGRYAVRYEGFYCDDERCFTGKFRYLEGGGHFWLWPLAGSSGPGSL